MTVELFCGIGGFRLACDRLGLKTIWANDINHLSCEVYRQIFGPGEIHEGDLKDIHHEIPSHDLLTAGFPCQPFSSAGKKQGIRDPRGTLFQEIVRVVKRLSPKYFVLENVKRLLLMEGGDHFATILSALTEMNYLIEWRLLNAQSFNLPQNRERVVIIGTQLNDFSETKIRLCTLKDLVNVIKHNTEILSSFRSWYSLEKHRKRFPNWGLAFKGKFYACDIDGFSDAFSDKKLHDILEENPDESFFMDDSTNERLIKSTFINRFIDGVRILYNQNGGARMGYTVFGTDGVAPALTASHSRHYERYKVGDRYRRLTNVEYARLQGFPDQHCKVASVFNQYVLYGNAVPPPLAEWTIHRLIFHPGHEIGNLKPTSGGQLTLFRT